MNLRNIHRLAAAIATALVVLLATPSAGQASTPPGFFGMIDLERTPASDLRMMAADGVQTIRLPVAWTAVEFLPGVRSWTAYDSWITDIATAGLTPFAQLNGVPRWVNPHGQHAPVYTQGEREAWMRFLTDFAARYGNNGTFWAEHPELPYRPITTWEVWNEPNLTFFWDGRPNPARYAELLQITRAGLRSGDPNAQVILGGMFLHVQKRFGLDVGKFLKKLYRVPGVAGTFDGVGIHPYAVTPREVIANCREFRRLMAKNHDASKPMWISEVGWTTGGASFRRSPFRTTERGQARNLRKLYRLAIRNQARLRLQAVFWHSWRDFNPPGTHNPPWTNRMGLFHVNGRPKPSLGAYVRIAR